MKKSADAEVAKQLGGMIALVPSAESVAKLLIDGGEPAEDLHLTLAYLGEDVSVFDSSLGAVDAARAVADSSPAIYAKAMGHATFNPSGDEPCAVYLIGDNPYLPELKSIVMDTLDSFYEMPYQHTPWIPHVTAGYDFEAADLEYTGPVVFDAVVATWSGEQHIFPLFDVGPPE